MFDIIETKVRMVRKRPELFPKGVGPKFIENLAGQPEAEDKV